MIDENYSYPYYNTYNQKNLNLICGPKIMPDINCEGKYENVYTERSPFKIIEPNILPFPARDCIIHDFLWPAIDQPVLSAWAFG